MEGKILGNRYELIEKIGGGGMAMVYKARCRLLNRFVAIKILRTEFTNDEEFVKRFRIEAQAAASLSHPNIVSIFDVGQENDIHYIVMEYVDGITLKDYINEKGVLPWKEAVKIGIQICSAIEQAHKNHIVHRDIKPHNILITKEGIAKVTDFGIARAVTASTITMVGSTIGSVHYFSPEQARGAFTDEKSDLYSLGITIYEMITGKVPFDGETPVAVALKHIQTNAEPPLSVNPDIPKGLNDIVMKAIRKEQNARYSTASEMLSELQRILIEPGSEFSDNYQEEFPTRRITAVERNQYAGNPEENPEPGEDDSVKAKKKDRLSVWLGVLTGLLIAGVCFYFGYKIVIPMIMPTDKTDFIVTDYVGRNYNDVQEELKKNNIDAQIKKRTNQENKDKDVILSQSVNSGQPLNPGSTIYFEVSDGPAMVRIPDDLKGKETRLAESALEVLGLTSHVKQENSDTVGEGCIIRTEPAVGEEVKPGTDILLVESLGPLLQKVVVPDLAGKTRTEAEKLLQQKKLAIGKLLPDGVVSNVAKITGQYPKANTSVDEGTAVDLTFDITTEQTTTSQNQATLTPAGSSARKTLKESVTLTDPDKYGDEIKVYIEAVPSDTNQVEILVNRKVKKDQFPLPIEIPVPDSGTTHVTIKFDDKVVLEVDRP